MNELTREDMKLNRGKAKVIKEAESPEMKKRVEIMRKIEDRKAMPKITEREYFDELFNTL